MGQKHLDLIVRCLEQVNQNIFFQMVMQNGDESHGRIRKKNN